MVEGTSEIEQRGIVLTENAARRIAMLKDQEQVEDTFLRISVSGGGCSGFQYGFTFDDQRHHDDFVFERDGVAVVVDDVSLGLLDGAEIDRIIWEFEARKALAAEHRRRAEWRKAEVEAERFRAQCVHIAAAASSQSAPDRMR